MVMLSTVPYNRKLLFTAVSLRLLHDGQVCEQIFLNNRYLLSIVYKGSKLTFYLIFFQIKSFFALNCTSLEKLFLIKHKKSVTKGPPQIGSGKEARTKNMLKIT
jgi:hypothetical protein